MQTKTKTIAMILLIAIATIGAIGISVGTGIQSVNAAVCGVFDGDGRNGETGQSCHDQNGDANGHNGQLNTHP